jgi:putative ubiquitin-RnfH superfamily antitoxin RatB of RatAB toxin-antitoxin module
MSTMRVSLLYAEAPRTVHEAQVELAEGATVANALNASGWAQRFPDLLGPAMSLGVWGRRCTTEQVLRDGDRVEAVRALRVDPKVARRERFQGQGARGAGLFAKRRPGSKAGY